ARCGPSGVGNAVSPSSGRWKSCRVSCGLCRGRRGTVAHCKGSRSLAGALRGGPPGSLALLRTFFFGRTVEELADQVFQHHGGLREFYRAAIGQVLVVAAGCQADVLLSQQPRGQDRGRGVFWEGIGLVQGQRVLGLEPLIVYADL